VGNSIRAQMGHFWRAPRLKMTVPASTCSRMLL
jgi:hypothetical protein